MRVSVFGAGYVGLVTGTCLAELGNEVTCYDIDEDKIKMLERGDIPIYEPGLKELLERKRRDMSISFSNDESATVDFGSIIFIAVGTPSADNGDVYLGHVESAARAIGRNLNSDNKIIISKSTVPVGTALIVRSIIQEELDTRCKKIRFEVASNPEFLKEGSAIDDFMRPDRIVVGTDNEWAAGQIKELYDPLVKNGHPIFIVDIPSAEMSKYASNAFLATKISFINEISTICEATGADIENVRKIMAADKRIGNHFLYPGIGYGGSCFPKDVLGLASIARKHGCSSKITNCVDIVNKEQCQRFIKKIKEEMTPLRDKTLAIWGLSFKPNTNDMREAPSVTIVEDLLKQGSKIKAYDPIAEDEARKIFGEKIGYEKERYSCLSRADALIIVTEWPIFKTLDFEKMRAIMKTPTIFDGRNIYSLEQMKKSGFTYISIGRKKISPF